MNDSSANATSIDLLLQRVLTEMMAMAGWEALAVVLAIAYLVLAMRRSLWCWPAAFASTLIYTLLFWQVALLMESALNVYYMGMAIYGFWAWRFGGFSRQSSGDGGVEVNTHCPLPISRWPLRKHLLLILATTAASLIAGYLMASYTQADFPYLDAATTCFAVVTTVLVARKVLENWLYWIVIDAASIYLYLEKGLVLTAILFVIYIVLAIFGYFGWRRELRNSVDSRLADAYA